MADHDHESHEVPQEVPGGDHTGAPPAGGHESNLESYTGSELPYRALYLTGIALFVVMVVFAVVLIPMGDLFVGLADRRVENEIVPSDQRPPAARLQQSPEMDWRIWEQLMDERLATYGWQDRSRGIARIPVDRAVDLALEEGLIPSAPDAPAASFAAGRSRASDSGLGSGDSDAEAHSAGSSSEHAEDDGGGAEH